MIKLLIAILFIPFVFALIVIGLILSGKFREEDESLLRRSPRSILGETLEEIQREEKNDPFEEESFYYADTPGVQA